MEKIDEIEGIIAYGYGTPRQKAEQILALFNVVEQSDPFCDCKEPKYRITTGRKYCIVCELDSKYQQNHDSKRIDEIYYPITKHNTRC